MKKELEIKNLTLGNLPQVIELQEKIVKNLHVDEQHFVLHRTGEDFKKALNSKHTHILGIFDGDNLIGQTIFSCPVNNHKREMAEFLPDAEHDKLLIYKAIFVDPQYRGSGLMKAMLEKIEHEMLKEGKETSIIQIAVDNPASWISAMHHGMEITKIDLDPEDSAQVMYLQKKLHKKSQGFQAVSECKLPLGSDIHKNMPILFNKMKNLTEKGYHAAFFDKSANQLIWHKSEVENKRSLSPKQVLSLASQSR